MKVIGEVNAMLMSSQGVLHELEEQWDKYLRDNGISTGKWSVDLPLLQCIWSKESINKFQGNFDEWLTGFMTAAAATAGVIG